MEEPDVLARILRRFSYLKYFTSQSIFIWKNGKTPMVSKRENNFHVQFHAKDRVNFTSKKRRNSFQKCKNKTGCFDLDLQNGIASTSYARDHRFELIKNFLFPTIKS